MDRTERFYKIELLLRSRGCVSFDTLQDELDVSPATLKRDLQYLRDRLSVPIVYDRLDNGYRFDAVAPGAKVARQELPGMWFSEKEIHALLTMHQLMAGLDDDGVLSRHLAPMMDKLQGMLGADESEARELMRRVKVTPSPSGRAGGASVQQVIHSAAREAHTASPAISDERRSPGTASHISPPACAPSTSTRAAAPAGPAVPPFITASDRSRS